MPGGNPYATRHRYLQALLKAGADASLASLDTGATPLHIAAQASARHTAHDPAGQ